VYDNFPDLVVKIFHWVLLWLKLRSNFEISTSTHPTHNSGLVRAC